MRKFIFFILILLAVGAQVWAVDFGLNLTTEGETKPGEVAETIEILAVLSLIVFIPSILVMMTSFTRIIIVFGFLRRALGLQTMPPDSILIGIALFLTMFIMEPTGQRIYKEAIVPYKAGEGTEAQFRERFMAPIRDFMFSQTRKKDLKTMLDLSGHSEVQTEDEVPSVVLIPAFVISELTRAFIIGFYIYLPFFLIDMVVAAVLMSMGMMMLPPIIVSLPFKILLFVLIDGWNLLIINLIKGFLPAI